MRFSWEKVMPHKPHVLETAKGWYEKWIRGDRLHTSANDTPSAHIDPYPQGVDGIDAYAETVKLEDVVEVKAATRDVASRLEALEFAGMAQAETVKSLGNQNQAFSRHLEGLQQELRSVDQRLQEFKGDAASHQAVLDSLDMNVRKLSGDISRLSARANAALWVAAVGVVGSVVALSLVFIR